MSAQPALSTRRLILRPFVPEDAAAVQCLAGAYEVARHTSTIPHPYPDGAAASWIAGHEARLAAGEAALFALVLRSAGRLIGAMELHLAREHRRAELGYWIGVPYWNQGFATEAARAVLRYAFEELALRRVTATHFAENPASGRVMQKIGMVREGCLRQHILRWGEPHDLVVYGLLREE